MPVAGALVLQAVGLASLREAERAAASLRAVQPDLEHIVIGDAETLRQATATCQRKIDVEEGLDATIRAALRRAALWMRAAGGGAAPTTVGRSASRASLICGASLLDDYVVSMDADSLACQSRTFWWRAPGTWRSGPCRSLSARAPRGTCPPTRPSHGALLVLRNTTASRNLLATWAALYASYSDEAPDVHQPLLGAALHETGARVRYLPVRYGCAVWSASAQSCPAYTGAMKRAVAAPARAVRRDKLGGPNAALWRAHERALNREPCVLLHGLHG